MVQGFRGVGWGGVGSGAAMFRRFRYAFVAACTFAMISVDFGYGKSYFAVTMHA